MELRPINVKITERNSAYLINVWRSDNDMEEWDAAATVATAIDAARDLVQHLMDGGSEAEAVQIERLINWHRHTGAGTPFWTAECVGEVPA
jgi:hypothetical protein